MAEAAAFDRLVAAADPVGRNVPLVFVLRLTKIGLVDPIHPRRCPRDITTVPPLLRLRTFGGLSIARVDTSTPSPGATSARRGLALFAVVAASGSRGVPRDRLLAMFWPESDAIHARHALDQTLYKLKRDNGAALLLGREELSLDPAVVTSDIGDFRSALERCDHAVAIDLYAGPFLDGVYVSGAPEFERWVDAERVALTHAVESALETLAAEAGARGDRQAAVQWCQRLAALDPRKTRSVLALMSALATDGDRTAALRYAGMYRALVRDDDDVEPNPAVASLEEQLRRQPAPAASLVAPAEANPSAPAPAAPATANPSVQSPGGAAPAGSVAEAASFAVESEALAGRYVIEREIGRGGSATVYLARDRRNERHVAIKVLRPELAAGIELERFRHEITVTTNLQHPHILPVHDSGEANGTLFFVMPFVPGESLRERLTREGRIVPAEGVRLATEIADALGYAHARGIIHRDIKPENILLSGGHAIVADFGLARALDLVAGPQLTTPGTVAGTLAYLSPEQVRGQQADALSDQYSLAYVLYELLAGEPAFTGPGMHELMAQRLATDPPALRTRCPDVPVHLEEAILRALSRDPTVRFADVATFARALSAPPTVAKTTRRAQMVRRVTPRQMLAAAAIALAPIVGFSVVELLGAPPVPERAWIVLADFENATGDSIFDRALDAALFAGLHQSDYVSVFPRPRVEETLARMGVTGSEARTRLDEARAREVALRDGIRAVVAGAIHAVDGSYLITLRVTDARTGDPLAADSRHAGRRADVLSAMDELVRSLRRAIGESAEAIAKHDVPLPRATTSSLEALRKYADGAAAWRAGQTAVAKELWYGAVALDSSFALAHAELGKALYWSNDRPRGDWHFELALSLADRLSTRERLQIRAASEEWRGNRDRAIELRRALLAEYPNDPRVWSAIGYNYLRLGRPADAIAAFRKQIERDSTFASDHVNLATALTHTGEYDVAVRSYQRAFALEPALLMVNNLNHEYGRAFVLAGRPGDARAAYDSMLGGTTDQRAHGERSIGYLDLLLGRYDTAIAHFRQAVLLSTAPNRRLTEARNRLILAAAAQAKGREWRDSASAEIRAAHALFRTGYLEPTFLWYLGTALSRDDQLAGAQEVLDTLRQRVRLDSPTDRANLLALTGEVALARQLADSAVRSFQLAIAIDSSTLVTEALARALAQAGDTDGAIRLYESIAGRPELWFGWEPQSAALLAPWNLGRLHEARGDTTRAVAAYARLLAQWPAGDSDLVAIRDARARLAELQPGDDKRSVRR